MNSHQNMDCIQPWSLSGKQNSLNDQKMYLLIPEKKMNESENKKLHSMKLTDKYDSSRSNVTGSKKNIDSLDDCDNKKRLSFIDPNCSHLSISRQIELLGISRSNYYYVPVIDPEQNKIVDFQ